MPKKGFACLENIFHARKKSKSVPNKVPNNFFACLKKENDAQKKEMHATTSND
jgi:hypothetical protein